MSDILFCEKESYGHDDAQRMNICKKFLTVRFIIVSRLACHCCNQIKSLFIGTNKHGTNKQCDDRLCKKFVVL